MNKEVSKEEFISELKRKVVTANNKRKRPSLFKKAVGNGPTSTMGIEEVKVPRLSWTVKEITGGDVDP